MRKKPIFIYISWPGLIASYTYWFAEYGSKEYRDYNPNDQFYKYYKEDMDRMMRDSIRTFESERNKELEKIKLFQ